MGIFTPNFVPPFNVDHFYLFLVLAPFFPQTRGALLESLLTFMLASHFFPQFFFYGEAKQNQDLRLRSSVSYTNVAAKVSRQRPPFLAPRFLPYNS